MIHPSLILYLQFCHQVVKFGLLPHLPLPNSLCTAAAHVLLSTFQVNCNRPLNSSCCIIILLSLVLRHLLDWSVTMAFFSEYKPLYLCILQGPQKHWPHPASVFLLLFSTLKFCFCPGLFQKYFSPPLPTDIAPNFNVTCATFKICLQLFNSPPSKRGSWVSFPLSVVWTCDSLLMNRTWQKWCCAQVVTDTLLPPFSLLFTCSGGKPADVSCSHSAVYIEAHGARN